MKLPSLFPKKFPQLFRRKKLQAATTRRTASGEEYAEEEPNVDLWKAFIVVLILHVVAVSGYYAFNSIKAHQPPATEATQPSVTKSENDERATDFTPAVVTAANVSSAKTYRVKPGDTLSKIALSHGVSQAEIEEANGLKNVAALRPGQELKIPVKQAAVPVASEPSRSKTAETKRAASPFPKDSGETYTVVKGDKLTTIAKKLRVNSEDLVKLNKIEDPTKLQIGQKLKIPVKANK